MTVEDHIRAFFTMFPNAPNPENYPKQFEALVKIYKHVIKVREEEHNGKE